MTTSEKFNNVLISGSSGLIGSALRRHLSADGFQVYGLSRSDSSEPFYYDQQSGRMHLDPDIPLAAVINLAGVSLAEGRWNHRRKQLIKDSRVLTTQRLSEALIELPQPPATLLSASALGYYGDTASEVAYESTPAGDSFLADVSVAWEQATEAAKAQGIRTVNLRFGLVLSTSGGVLPNFILPLRLAAVGRVGDGRQYLSWIHIEDCVRVIRLALGTGDLSGPVNVVSNHAVTNDEFTRSVSRALGRPRLPPLPATVVKLLFGEMGEEALLASGRIKSQVLDARQFVFQYPHLDQALEALLKS